MAIHGWYVFVVMDDLVTFRGRTRQLGLRAQQFNTADPASLSLGHTCIYHIPSRAIDPPERRLLRKMHLIYSSPRATLLHPVLFLLLLVPLLLLPLSSVLPFYPLYKVSSRFNPKDTSHGKYSLIATFGYMVLVFFMRGRIRGHLLS